MTDRAEWCAEAQIAEDIFPNHSVGCVGSLYEVGARSLVFQPAALCASMIELSRRLRAIVASRDLQEEVRAWQDHALRDFFQRRPLALLEEAISIKNKSLSRSPSANKVAIR